MFDALLTSRCIVHVPEMMPHTPVPADATASMMYWEPTPLDALTSVSPVSPGVSVPPHAIVFPFFASWICVELSLCTGPWFDEMLPDVRDWLHET